MVGKIPFEDDKFKKVLLKTSQFIEFIKKEEKIYLKRSINFEDQFKKNEYKGIFKLRPKKDTSMIKL